MRACTAVFSVLRLTSIGVSQKSSWPELTGPARTNFPHEPRDPSGTPSNHRKDISALAQYAADHRAQIKATAGLTPSAGKVTYRTIATAVTLMAVTSLAGTLPKDADAAAVPAPLSAQRQFQIDIREPPYNAAGDGATDDTAAFTSAISAVNVAGGGTLYIPRGTYRLNSATVAVLANHAYLIAKDDVTIKGDGYGQTRIQLMGTGECGFLLGRNVNNFRIQDLTFYGNSCHAAGSTNITGSFVWWDNSGATADHHGFRVERCHIENCKATEWVYALCYEGHDMNDVKIRDNRFVSCPGNMVGTETGVASTAVRLYAPHGKANWLRDYEISGNICEGRYIRAFFDAHYQVQQGSVHNNEIHDVGADLATKQRQCYGISFYANGNSHASVYANRILHPYSCGIYAVTSNDLSFADNYIIGQVDDDDSRLLKGGYAIANAANVTIKGGLVEGCVMGIQVQPANSNAQILIDGVEVKNCSHGRAFNVRPIGNGTRCGGVTITNCQMENTDLVVGRSSNLYVDNVTVSNNVIRNGHIRWTKPANDCIISNNRISTTGSGACALYLSGGKGFQIVNNHIEGPGSRVPGSCGICLGSALTNPSAITGNTISGFKNGLRGALASCTFKDNVFADVEAQVEKGTKEPDTGKRTPK